MKLQTKLLNKTLGVLIVIVRLVSTIFTSLTPVQASTLVLDKPTTGLMRLLEPNVIEILNIG